MEELLKYIIKTPITRSSDESTSKKDIFLQQVRDLGTMICVLPCRMKSMSKKLVEALTNQLIREYLELSKQYQVIVNNFEYFDIENDFEFMYQIFKCMLMLVKTKYRDICVSNANTLYFSEITKFSGTIIEWRIFEENFRFMVDGNTMLTDVGKLNILRKCVQGETKEFIADLPIKNSSYQKSWKILRKMYENQGCEFGGLIHPMYDARNIDIEKAETIRDLLAATFYCIRGAKAANISLRRPNVFIARILIRKLDSEAFQQYKESALKDPEQYCLQGIMEFLKQLFLTRIGHFKKMKETNATKEEVATPKPREEENTINKEEATPKPREEKNKTNQEVATPKPREDKNKINKEVATPKPREEQNTTKNEAATFKPRENKNTANKEVATPKTREEKNTTNKEVATPKPREEKSTTKKEVVTPKPQEEKNTTYKEVATPKPREEKNTTKKAATPKPQQNTKKSSQISQSYCEFCKIDGHLLTECSQFTEKTILERSKFVEIAQICKICLTHQINSKCSKSIENCKKCSQNHHILLQCKNITPDAKIVRLKELQEKHLRKLYPTVQIKAATVHGDEVSLRAMLGCCVQSTSISKEAVKRLKLYPWQSVDKKTLAPVTKAFLTIFPYFTDNGSHSIHAHVKDDMNLYLPVQAFTVDKKPWQNYCLADPVFNLSQRIDVIIGTDILKRIIRPGVMQINGTTCTNTTFGWFVTGELHTSHSHALCTESLGIPNDLICNPDNY